MKSTVDPHTSSPPAWHISCPVQIPSDDQRISLAHGEGGRVSRQLLRELILPELGGEHLALLDDAARLPRLDGPIAFSTDSFVVSPPFFPGGDIGSLAVYGTVNDLAVNGARPRWLTLSLILEEGLPRSVLQCVLQSASSAAHQSGVEVVAGDTKVVPRGAADGLFINTAGIGELIEPLPPGSAHLQVGDELVISGPIGRHGMAVLAARENLASAPPLSDAAPLVAAAESLRLVLGHRIRAMRDATRGGVAAVLHEWAAACGHTLSVNEASLPVSPEVRGACEILGLDAIHVANEGTMLVAVEGGAGQSAVAALESTAQGKGAAIIGRVIRRALSPVLVERGLGPARPLDDPLGAPLPRIC